MKKLVSILLSAMVILGIMILTGCDESKTYTVKLMNGDTVIQTIEVSAGDKVTLSLDGNPTKADADGYRYTFDKWMNGEAAWDFDTMTVSGDLTLTASFTSTMIDYTATVKYYDTDSKENYQTEETVVYNVGNKADKLAEITAKLPETTTQYSYAWAEALPAELPLESKTYTVNRAVKTYTVKFMNGETELQSSQLVYGSKVSYDVDGNPTKADADGYRYTFDKWMNGEAAWDFDTMTVSGDLTLTASFTSAMIDYTATVKYYDTDSKENYQTEETVVYNVGNKADKLAEIVAKLSEDTVQYSYAWAEALPVELPLENKTYTINRTTKTYTVKFVNGETELQSGKLAYGAKVTYNVDGNPTKADENGYRYTFDKWMNGEAAWDFETMTVSGDLTLTASFTSVMIDYTATIKYYDTDSKENYQTEETVVYNVGNKTDRLAEIVAKLPEGTAQYSYAWAEALPSELPLESKTYTVNRAVKTYTVKFMNGETELQSGKLAYGAKVSYNVDGNPTKADADGYRYTFDKWMNGEAAWDFDTMTVSGDLTLTASFTQEMIDYTATIKYYDTDSKEDYQTEETVVYNVGNKTDRLADIVAKLPEGTVQYSYAWAEALPAELPLENKTYTVNRTTKTYTVTFDSKGGSSVDSQNVKYGSLATKPADPTKSATDTVSYKFYSWYYNDAAYDFSTAITGDITLIAKYKESTVSVNYVDSEDNIDSSNLETLGSVQIVKDQGKYLSVNLNTISGAKGKMSLVTKNSYTNITKVSFKVIMDSSKNGGGTTWWGINYFTDYSTTDIYDNQKTTYASYDSWTVVEFTFNTSVTGYIGIIGAKGEFVNPVILIDDFTIYCDEGTIVDDFDNSGLSAEESGLLVKAQDSSEISIVKVPGSLTISNPNNALAIKLKDAVSNSGSAIAFATTTAHIYKEVSFDLYMPLFEEKTGWIGGFAFQETIGDNYTGVWTLASGYTKGAWNKISFRISGTTATYYVNGQQVNTATISENATYFYIWLNPGDGDFTDDDILLIDNLSIVDNNGYTFEDFDNKTTTLLTASHNLLKEFDYVTSTVARVESLTVAGAACGSEKIKILSNRAYTNISSIDFDFYVDAGFNQTWGGIDLNSAPTDIYNSLNNQSKVGFMTALVKGKTYHISITINEGTMTLVATCEGEETKTFTATVTTNENLYVVFYQEANSGSLGYVISNYSVVAGGITYTGLENLCYPAEAVATEQVTNFEGILAAGDIEDYLAAGSTSISANEIGEDIVITEGSIEYTLNGDKEFAVVVGKAGTNSVYIVVDGDNVYVYSGSTRCTAKGTLTLGDELTYEIDENGVLYVNDTEIEVTVTTLVPMSIVAFGGYGLVTFDSISVVNSIIA